MIKTVCIALRLIHRTKSPAKCDAQLMKTSSQPHSGKRKMPRRLFLAYHITGQK